jgi:hypothetical protein
MDNGKVSRQKINFRISRQIPFNFYSELSINQKVLYTIDKNSIISDRNRKIQFSSQTKPVAHGPQHSKTISCSDVKSTKNYSTKRTKSTKNSKPTKVFTNKNLLVLTSLI